MSLMENITVIGTGVIGKAIVQSLLKKKYDGKIIATKRHIESLKDIEKIGAEISSDNKYSASKADIIFICVKPSNVESVLKEIKNEIVGKILISTVATIPLKYYKKIVPKTKIIRTMPNIAVLVQESFTAFCCGNDITELEKNKIKKLLGMMGVAKEVEEKHMDAITGLSGSAPGYISIIIEALTYGGLKVGLPRDLALYSAAQAVLGTGKLILKTKGHPAEIKDMATTPGGTTIEAIYELEGSQIRQALMRAVQEATRKCKDISRKNYN